MKTVAKGSKIELFSFIVFDEAIEAYKTNLERHTDENG